MGSSQFLWSLIDFVSTQAPSDSLTTNPFTIDIIPSTSNCNNSLSLDEWELFAEREGKNYDEMRKDHVDICTGVLMIMKAQKVVS